MQPAYTEDNERNGTPTIGDPTVMTVKPISIKKRVQLAVRRALREAEAAAIEAEKAIPYLAGGCSERRRALAQVAQDAAQLAIQKAQTAEQALQQEDYDAATVTGGIAFIKASLRRERQFVWLSETNSMGRYSPNDV
jgi:hypothetical protein